MIFHCIALSIIGLLWSASSALADEYPPQGIATLRTTCAQRKDIPAAAMSAYCDCYVEQIQKAVSWRDFLFVDSAIRVKGIQNLDAEEKAIMVKALDTTFYCSEKATR